MKKFKLKVVFFGTPDFALPIPITLAKNFDLQAVVTSQVLTPSPIKTWAQNHQIPVFTPEKLDYKIAQKLEQFKPDLFIVASYGKIIPQHILDIPKFGVLNIHFSKLPSYRGASPMQSAILNGDKETGISIIKMDEKIDHGPVIYTEEFSLLNLDNFQTLSTNMFLRSAKILPKIITAFVSGKLTLKVQDETKVTYCKLITKEDGYFELPTEEKVSSVFSEKLDRMIRAFYPWPGVWTKWSPQPHQTRFARRASPVKAKKIIKFLPGGLIQMEGKKPVKLEDFLRGYPNFPLKSITLDTK